MAHYLRDKRIGSLTITEEDVRELCDIFFQRMNVVSATRDKPNEPEIKGAHFVIRFDNRGYKAYSTDDVLTYWRQATKVERLVFATESFESLNSNRLRGTYVELKLDLADEQCWLVSSSDSKEWMDGSFTAIDEYLTKCKNKNRLIRTPWTPFAVYVLGQAVILALSLWLVH